MSVEPTINNQAPVKNFTKKKRFYKKPMKKKTEEQNITYETSSESDTIKIFSDPATSTIINPPIISTPTYNPFSLENNLFSHLRLTSGFNPETFWKNLDIVLAEKDFKEIKTSDMNIFSYVVLYGKDQVYRELIEKFQTDFSQDLIEKSLFPLCLNKNSVFIKTTLDFYTRNYIPTTETQQHFIDQVTKLSYRNDNNNILLEWFNYTLQKEQIEYFWNKCIDNNNVVLFEKALEVENLSNYLKQNYNDFKDRIIQLGKEHTTLNSISNNKHKRIAKTSVEKNIQEPLSENSTTENNSKLFNQPEVVIKKRKKLV